MKYGSNHILIGTILLSIIIALITNKVFDYTNNEGFQMNPSDKIKVLLNSVDFSEDSLDLKIPLVVENKISLSSNAISLKPLGSNTDCRLIFENAGELGQLKHKFMNTGASTVMPMFGVDEYTGKAINKKDNVLTMDTLKPSDILLYGNWISSGNKNKPVGEIRKEGNRYAFISKRGRYVKIVKTDQYLEDQKGYYYDGNIRDYGKKALSRAPAGAYVLKLAPNRILYKGCFGDKSSRAMGTHLGNNKTFADAVDMARKRGFKYVGLQYANGWGYKGAQIFAENNSQRYKKYGTRKCTKMNTGHIAGGDWTNAVYQLG